MFLWEKDKIPFYNDEYMNGFVPEIYPYIVEGSKSCVVICPGGGYSMKAVEHEGTHIALRLNSYGVSAFVLDYRHSPYKHPVPVIDAKRAIRYARFLSKEYGYDKDKIGIMGFSAGAHLAGCAGVFTDDFGYEPIDEIDNENSRPDFMALCYPVITFGPFGHMGSFYALSSDHSEEMAKELSVENHVNENTPPTFLIHAIDDEGVPVENSLIMASTLSKHKVPFEIHTFNSGNHGFGLGDGKSIGQVTPYTDMWPNIFKNWLGARNLL